MSDTEKFLKDLGKRIDELVEKAKDATGDWREELDETIEKLKAQRDRFEEKMQDAKTRNEPKFQDAKVHLRAAMEEMNMAFQKMFRKGPDDGES